MLAVWKKLVDSVHDQPYRTYTFDTTNSRYRVHLRCFHDLVEPTYLVVIHNLRTGDVRKEWRTRYGAVRLLASISKKDWLCS